MAEHNTLTDPELHEPKGVSTATSGDVYVADGAGSGSWIPVSQSNTFDYAELYVLPSDSLSLANIGTTVQTFPFTTASPQNGAVADVANDRLTLTTAGVYLVTFTTSFSTVASGDSGQYSLEVLDDGVATNLNVQRFLSGTTDTGSLSTSGLLTVTAGTNLTVRISSDNGSDTDDIDIYSANFTAVLLRATG